MSRTFMSTILAAAIAITSVGVTPARADNSDQIVKFLAGAATLYLIGSAIEDARDDRDDRKPSKQHYFNERDQRHNGYGYGQQGRWNRGPAPLPSACLLGSDRRSHRGEAVFSARCLNNRYDRADRLPQNCVTRVRTDRGPRTVYRAQCLSRYGFQTARR